MYGCECGWRETAVHCCSNAWPSSSIMTYIRPASAWRLLVACADPVCCAIYLLQSPLVCPGEESNGKTWRFFVAIKRLISY